MKTAIDYVEKAKHLHKSTTMQFSNISLAVLTALVGASAQLQDAFVRWWGINEQDAMLIMVVVAAIVGTIGATGAAKGYMDSSSKKPVDER